ncbi:MAG: hypothetical protein N2316_12770 [Spirochaetes bacterium]|nr:hypothetical protein [Spirochaetota bacterium]
MIPIEMKFYQSLQDMFIGANIEGQGGFINLMRIKSEYYKKIENLLKEDIEEILANTIYENHDLLIIKDKNPKRGEL